MRIVDCIQGSEQWFEAHRGIASASNFDKVITPKTGKPSASMDDLVCELIGQICTQGSIAPEGYVSRPMLNGIQMEPEARRYYEFEKNVTVHQVGFCVSDCGRWGCSPDALIGEDGILELKCPTLKTQARYLLDGVLPAEYKPQCHGSLIVTGRAWLDFMSYAPGMKPLLIRVVPDDYTKALRECLDQFWSKYTEALKKLGLQQP